MNNSTIKTAVESALVALLVGACCLWFLISASNLDEPPAARMVLLGLALTCSLVAHWAFMFVAVKRSGRAVLPWMLAIVLLVPIGTVALLALLASEDKPQQA